MEQAILLDVEGTTTPIAFVTAELFPYARREMAAFLAQAGATTAVQADLARLRQDYDQEGADEALPPWQGPDPLAALPYLDYLMDRDRKVTGLKGLQGQVWEFGYRAGTLQGQIFPDVAPALKRWHQAGLGVYIFSSGSIQAQKLLFAHTPDGDLTPYLRGHFDTTTGPKQDPRSYGAIAEGIGLPPSQITFVSDALPELQAAHQGGYTVYLSHRPGNAPTTPHPFPTLTDFDALFP